MIRRYLIALVIAHAVSALSYAESAKWTYSSWCKFDDSIFPSYCISTATLKTARPPANQKGDPNGVLGMAITPIDRNFQVVVEISSPKFVRKSSLRVTLAEPGTRYVICPTLDYDFDALYTVIEPEPETVTFRILDGSGKQLAQTKKRFTVRSINDCFTGIRGETPHKEMYAAYVNENHPIVDKILQQALKQGLVPAFSGYQRGPEGVRKQVAAIWTVLQNMGIKYSSITTASASSPRIRSQHVRFLDDSLENTQANCVDGSVLMASIFRKIGLRTFLVLVPSHCYLGVVDDTEKKTTFEIETTMIGNGASIEAAIRNGSDKFEKARANFDKTDGYYTVDIEKARTLGIQPLRSRKVASR